MKSNLLIPDKLLKWVIWHENCYIYNEMYKKSIVLYGGANREQINLKRPMWGDLVHPWDLEYFSPQ